MRKIFAFLCALLLAVHFSAAQRNLYVIDKDGKLVAYSAASVSFYDDAVFINGHKFVDLGLPSGLLWAETNIGAETAIDNGNFYAWGETTTKSNYLRHTYKYYNHYNYYNLATKTFTKYNDTDGKTVLENADDAAYVNWGNFCRMPTQADFEELINPDNCTWTWTTMKDSSGSWSYGFKITSKRNDSSIFLPNSLYYREGYYWSSSMFSFSSSGSYNDSDCDPCILYFNDKDTIYVESQERYRGCAVRPVAGPMKNQKGQAILPIDSIQKKMVLVDGSDKVNAMKVSSVDFATFHADGSWFNITNDSIDNRTKNSISASCTVAPATSGGVKFIGVTLEVGVCYSKENNLPTINDDSQILGSSFGGYYITLSSLIAGTDYYYRVYIKLNDDVLYGDVVKVKTLGTKPNDKTINGHKFLDLGLPSGLLWAETNIGAKTAADDGNYYAWGETTTKSNYSWSTYKYGTSEFDRTKYNFTDGRTDLQEADDAAYMNWGSYCHIPTNEAFEELLNSDNCTWTWTTMKNSSGSSVNGYKVTSKRNNNYIFLPASGYRGHGDLYHYNSQGCYYSNMRSTDSANRVCELQIRDIFYRMGTGSRYIGGTVRPVAKPYIWIFE